MYASMSMDIVVSRERGGGGKQRVFSGEAEILVKGAMLVHPRLMCPLPKILGCCNPWTKCHLAILPLTEPSHPFDLIERNDTRLPTVPRFSAAKRWSSMCGPSLHSTEGRQSNKPGQGRRRSRPDAPLIH
jgi:hypothetical protein